MSKKSTCPYCGKYIETLDPYKTYKMRKYHLYCYRKLQAEKYSNAIADIDVKKELYNYIMKLLELDEMPVLIQNQIEKYCTNLEVNYKDIHDALYYYVEIEENKLNPKYGIGIIPTVIDESRKFFKDLENIHKKLKKQKVVNPDKIIKVNPKNYKLDRKLININEL